MMTVAELIKLLVDMPMNAQVLVYDAASMGDRKAVPVTDTVSGKKHVILCHIESDEEGETDEDS